jgi:hydroxyacyl-ACP dehydratase HTD2-like protein with hotdog domain
MSRRLLQRYTPNRRDLNNVARWLSTEDSDPYSIKQWEQQLKSSSQRVEQDTVTGSHHQLLQMTLESLFQESDFSDPVLTEPVAKNTVYPQGWHLALFPPRIPETLLSPDGSDTLHSPPPPFTKRMWAGGRFEWHGNPLRVGNDTRQLSSLHSVTLKDSHTRSTPSLYVTTRKDIDIVHESSVENALTEYRTLVYLDPSTHKHNFTKSLKRKNDNVLGFCVLASPASPSQRQVRLFSMGHPIYDHPLSILCTNIQQPSHSL